MSQSEVDFEDFQQRIAEEFEAMEATAEADAEAIYARIVSPDDDPDVALYQLLLINAEIKEKINFFSLLEFVKLCGSEEKSMRAIRQHEGRIRAREFVFSQWVEHRQSYAGNKSEFARHYVKRVLNEFNIRVTEKQMREVWLKDTPSASNPA